MMIPNMQAKLWLLLLSLVFTQTANAQDELYIYQHSGVTDTLQLTRVKSISHSRSDLNGRQQSDYVLMSIVMTDESVRSYLLTELDSVVMERDGHRTPLVCFVGGMNKENTSQRQAPRRTSMDGDFMASTGTVDFYWEPGDRIYLEDGTKDDEERAVYHEPDKAVADFYFNEGKVSGDAVTVYYPGQTPPTLDGKKVRVAKNQSQMLPNTTQHIGVSGDCGTAVATKRSDAYYFDLDHHAAYLCFLPYIGNNLGRTVLKKITVYSDKSIAGIFNLSTSGLSLDSDPSQSITLTTGGESGFILEQLPSQSVSAYMVIAPQSTSTRLTCEFTVYDQLLESTGVYTKILDLAQIERNQVYVVKANCNNYVVDLGLPVKFLNHNFGAFAPEDDGNYYAFGETSEKSSYSSTSFVPNVNTLGDNIRLTGNDVAHVKLRGNFSTPTVDEWRVLLDSCSSKAWLTVNGKNGCLFTGPNGNKLFLPAGGYRRYGNIDELNTRGSYSTTNLYRDYDDVREWRLNLEKNSYGCVLENSYYNGKSVRPVISAGVQMTDGSYVQVMTDSAQCRLNTQQATLFGTLNGYGKAKTTNNLEIGFLVGNATQVAAGEGTKVVATITGDGQYSAVFTMPKDTAYYYRAYVCEEDGSACFANTMQFGRAYADLGLPSGNLWSSVNLGCEVPEDKGSYYAWAETTTKSSYKDSNHRWYNGHIYTFPDGLRDIQATPYDVAAVEWGGSWVTPNKEDIQELVTYCNIVEESSNGMPGYRITSKVAGFTDRSIFMPKTGWWRTKLENYREKGYFLSSSLDESRSNYAYELSGGSLDGGLLRTDAIPVRPVNKSNAMSKSGKRMFIRTLPAGKRYNGTDAETDTLKAIVRGYTSDDTTVGIVWWQQDGTRATGTVVPLTPDANGYIKTVITGLTPGETYYYEGYVDNGTRTYYGETFHVDAVGLVDLGLSVKWSNMNVGAVNAEDGGSFYEWGATETYDNTSQYYVANKDITTTSGHDIASNNWGADFRMPTKEEWQELVNTDNCDWTWDTDRAGYVVTSKIDGYVGNSIFIPASGFFDYTKNFHEKLGSAAYYWASSVYDVDNSWRMWFNAGEARTVNYNYKRQGFSTRPVECLFDEVSTIGMSRNVRDVEEVDTLISFLSRTSGREVEAGFILGITDELTVETAGAQLLILSGVTDGINKYPVSGLTKGQTYYYRAYIKDGDAYTYGDVMKFDLLEMIDLGLPSGTLWTNINTGADYIEDFGDYYAWGETRTKDVYTQDNYEFYQNSSFLDIGNDIGGTQYDAATVNMGSNWRMPSQAQCAELVANTMATPVTIGGIACWKLTSTVPGYTDKFIIFPRNSQMKVGSLNNPDYYSNYGNGVYPTSTRFSNYQAYNMYMPDSGPSAGSGNYDEKYWGKNIRAVVQKTTDLGGGVYANIGTDGCDWVIGEATATLHGHAYLSETIEGATRGFIVGTIKEVDTPTPAEANIVLLTDGSTLTYEYPYTGGARYYRAFLNVGGQYYFGAVKTVTAADMLDVEFNANNEILDGISSGIPSEKHGDVQCPYNDTYKRYEGDFSSNNASYSPGKYYTLNYSGFDVFINQLRGSHSIEILVQPQAVTSREANVIANYENGGDGIGIYSNKFYYCTNIDGYKYFFSETTPIVGNYYHVVAVWDRENAQIRFYVNGVLESTTNNVSTTLRMTEIKKYVVSGQPTDSGGADEGWKGMIGFIRFYTGSLTGSQVQTLYNGLTE